VSVLLVTSLLLALPPAVDAMPDPPVPDLAPLREDSRWQRTEALPAFAPARVHKAALEGDPLHKQAFWVEELAGDADSRRVVFLIPQFHRNPIVPLGWTSLGSAIMEVQSNIDTLVTRLSLAHGMRCIGTEGSWLKNIELPLELRQPAQWYADLERRQPAAKSALLREKKKDTDRLERVTSLLHEELRRTVALFDGVGLALSRLEESRVRRFGIEDEQLNRDALVLLAQLQRIDEALAELNPASQSAVQSAMGRMWLDEIEDYDKRVLTPLADDLARLDELRIQLRTAGADGAAEDLGRFVALAKLVAERVVRAAEVDGYTRYYKRVAAKTGDEPPPPPPPLTPKQEADKRELEAARGPLQKEYDAVSIDERERRAAQKVVQSLGAGGTCAVVMGAVHSDALRDRLLEAGGGDLAVVVVAPYSFDEASDDASDDGKLPEDEPEDEPGEAGGEKVAP
jgi:hypothetical protein